MCFPLILALFDQRHGQEKCLIQHIVIISVWEAERQLHVQIDTDYCLGDLV